MADYTWALLNDGVQVGGDTDYGSELTVEEFAVALAARPRPFLVDEVRVWDMAWPTSAEPVRARRHPRRQALAVAS